jgi:hypothetical protein
MPKTILILTAMLVTLAGCGNSGVMVSDGPEPTPLTNRTAPSTAATLGIPPGHLPPPGQCRIWRPGVPPGHQAPPGNCAILARGVPVSGWLVYRPSRNKKEVEVSVYDTRTPNRVVAVRFFDARSGKLLRERTH